MNRSEGGGLPFQPNIDLGTTDSFVRYRLIRTPSATRAGRQMTHSGHGRVLCSVCGTSLKFSAERPMDCDNFA
jgi:hypothetical protein